MASCLVCQNCEKGQLAWSCLSVRLYIWTEFHETWYLNIFRTVRKLKFLVNLTVKRLFGIKTGGNL